MLKLINNDSRKLSEQESHSAHAVITDPPYGIEFLGESWDKVLPPQEIWNECFRVLKPGGFCLSFGHSRLYHRMACQLEDAGFIIKDCLCWGYASGYPKSYNISKAFDKDAGAEREVIAKRVHPTLKNKPKVKSNAYHVESLNSDEHCESWDITAPATEEAKMWDGWGTALKPAWEPIVLAQKPLDGNYIENVRKYKVGVLNIDDCRIPYASEEDRKSLESFINFAGKDCGDDEYFSVNSGGKKQVNVHPLGRWPANVMWLDPIFADYDRFFLVPKPSKSEKKSYNTHRTVKPVDLMKRLVTLVTPKPSQIGEDVWVVDPFMGSGTTGVACRMLGRSFLGYEKDTENGYFDIAKKRIESARHRDKSYDMFEV